MKLTRTTWFASRKWVDTEPASQDSAMSRCPEEIWRLILFHVAHAPSLVSVQGSLDRLRGDGTHHGLAMVSAAIDRARILALVCRSWNEPVMPLLLDTVILDCKRTGTATILLEQSFMGQIKASWVRKLHVRLEGHLEHFGKETDRFCWMISQATALIQIISNCSHLEEFTWSAPSDPQVLTQALRALCGRLTSLIIETLVPLQMEHLTDVITRCPNLRTIICDRCFLYGELPGGLEDGHPRTVAPSPLRTVAIQIDRHCWPLIQLMSSLSINHLRHLRISFRRMTSLDLQSPLDLTPLQSVIETWGRTLLSLEVYFPPWQLTGDGGRTFLLFNLCPNVEEFIFHISQVNMEEDGFIPHPALRRVGIHGVFLAPFIRNAERIEQHLHGMPKIFDIMCSADFPRLEAIRCMDSDSVWSQTRRTRALPYRQVMEEVAGICAQAEVRFENRWGELFHP